MPNVRQNACRSRRAATSAASHADDTVPHVQKSVSRPVVSVTSAQNPA